MNKLNTKQIVFKVIYIYILLFLFFLLLIEQNRWANDVTIHILSTIAFCFAGGFIPFTIAKRRKVNYKKWLIIIPIVGFVLSVGLGYVIATYMSGFTGALKAILFLASYLSVDYFICDYTQPDFTFFDFKVNVRYFRYTTIIACAFLIVLFVFDSYILSSLRGVSWYGVIIGTGFMMAIALALGLTKERGLKSDLPFDLILWIFPLSIVGARIYYVLFTLHEFNWTFTEIIAVWNGGLAIYGGIIGGTLGLIICCLIKKVNIVKVMDLAAPALILGQAIGRWGNFVNQEAYGTLVANDALKWFPFAVFVENTSTWHLATFFYESVLSLIGCIVLIYIIRKYKITGIVVASYFIWYGLERVLIEGLRTDSLYIGTSSIRVSQLLSGILVVAGIVWLTVLIIMNSGKNKKVNEKDHEI